MGKRPPLILIADDSLMVQDVVLTILASAGLSGNALPVAEAVRAARGIQPDLLITDQLAPFECLDPATPILYTNPMPDTERMLLFPQLVYLPKPFRAGRLVEEIQHLLRVEVAVSA